jgi:carbamoyl-phosphate synthase small subunit
MKENKKQKKSALILSDGTRFEGVSFGTPVSSSGEVVFNTGMVGYPETLTDPSYKGQILVLTYPLIGNYGIPDYEKMDDILLHFESDKIHVAGFIISDYSLEHSHWNAAKSLGDWLQEHNIPALYGIDTRELTKKLRTEGVMTGKIVIDKDIDIIDPNLENQVARVSCNEVIEYKRGPKKIVLVDCGCKNNIIRSFLDRDISITRVPWDYDFHTLEYDGLFISNGPGDPKHCKILIKNMIEAMKDEKPIFGICLGSQILSLAAGADTYKLKYGHRSQNQPCVEVGTKRCYITSQNHGYAVNQATLPNDWEPWFVNANDNTNEGIKHKTRPFFAVQFHPEATPGPVETQFLFDEFVELL